MERLSTVIMLVVATITQVSIANAQTQRIPDQQSDLKSITAPGDLSDMPPMPRGKSTILGGEIRSVDPVLDQFTLRVFGQRPLKILFDERTQVFRNGEKISLRDLHPEEHASVQTILDGANVFAVSIHMLSQLPESECQGHVLSYNPDTRELSVGSSLTRDPIRLLVRDNTPVVRQGQGGFTSASAGSADLVNGALVLVNFDTNGKGQAVASRVTVLARPGSDFVFSGKLSSLDLHAGLLVLVDPRDEKNYQISFDPGRNSASQNLHNGDQVRVVASFDGSRYMAKEITTIQVPHP
jgi:hypothetical protein